MDNDSTRGPVHLPLLALTGFVAEISIALQWRDETNSVYEIRVLAGS